MTNIYPFPPVSAVSRTWNYKQPVARSYSMLSGRRVASTSKRPRRYAAVTVHGRRNNGFGYMTALERLLEGGVHLVRIESCRLGQGKLTDMPEFAATEAFDWIRLPASQFKWTPDEEDISIIPWSTTNVVLTPAAGSNLTSSVPLVRLTGLPPFQLVATPGDMVEFTDSSANKDTVMVSSIGVTDASGTVEFRLVRPVSVGPTITAMRFGVRESGIFEIIGGFPELTRGGQGPENVPLQFREVFMDELVGSVVEINPW